MEAAKILDVQRSRTSRGRGIGTVGRSVRELGKPFPAPGLWMFTRGAKDAYKRSPVKSRSAGRMADGLVVPLERDGQHNRPRWEGALLRPCLMTTKGPAHALPGDNTAKQDKVRELQVKLYLAVKRSPSRRFHALWGRIHRRDVLQRAWRLVRENRGAPGIDGTTIAQIEESGAQAFLDELAVELKEQRYRPRPARRVYIPKPGRSEQRPLGIPSIADRVVQTAAKLVLEPIFEAGFRDCSFGFRPRRSAHDALDQIKREVVRGRRWVIDADIRGFFDALDQQILVSLLGERISDRRVLKLLRSWLRAGVLEGETLLRPEVGSPQGSPISPLLANVYLNALDRAWEDRHGGMGVLVRYCDDLVVLCKTRAQAEAALAQLRALLAELKLELAVEKTRLVFLDNDGEGSFVFLGFDHRMVESFSKPGRYFLACWPSSAATRAARQRIRELTDRRLLRLPVEDVVANLNRFLTGWAGYFRRGNSTTPPRLTVSRLRAHSTGVESTSRRRVLVK
jgi:group II intron reverse transcriptase/maturase